MHNATVDIEGSDTRLTMDVILPTYRRASALVRCLSALASQTRPANNIQIVMRHNDEETMVAANIWSAELPIKIVMVEKPGQVHALNAGLTAAASDIVCITDDDASPHNDWLQRIENHFRCNPKLGGLGGRDWVHENGAADRRNRKVVGIVQWFGRFVGNHHLGAGHTREVDILKGANMSFRVSAIRDLAFETRLRGEGAQVGNDLVFSMSAKGNGWQLMYDPAVAVDHFPAARFGGDPRHEFNSNACRNMAFNHYWAILSVMPKGPRRRMAILWQRIVGTNELPGIIHLILGVMRRDPHIAARWGCTGQGRSEVLIELQDSLANRGCSTR